MRLEVDKIRQREGRWVIPDLGGKGNRLRTVAIRAAVKVRIDAWTRAAKISEGKISRPVNKGNRVTNEFIADEKAIWQVVVHHALGTSLAKLAPEERAFGTCCMGSPQFVAPTYDARAAMDLMVQ